MEELLDQLTLRHGLAIPVLLEADGTQPPRQAVAADGFEAELVGLNQRFSRAVGISIPSVIVTVIIDQHVKKLRKARLFILLVICSVLYLLGPIPVFWFSMK